LKSRPAHVPEAGTEVLLRINHSAQTRISATSIGKQAADILDDQRDGRVLAVFERSFYVQFEADVICIGIASIGRGPLHVLLAPDSIASTQTICQGDSIRVVATGYTQSEQVTVAYFSGAVIGIPIVPCAIKNVRQALTHLMPVTTQGFACLSVSSCLLYRENTSNSQHVLSSVAALCNTAISNVDERFLKQTLPPIQNLFVWLESALQVPVENSPDTSPPIVGLLGAGPGLTPSGDDLLAGVLLALYRVQRDDLAATLWQVLEPELVQRTNIISGAHLRMAARGLCSEPVLSLLDCVFPEAVLVAFSTRTTFLRISCG